jgi:hypothetical protein
VHEREVDPLLQAPVEVVPRDHNLQGEIVGQWSKVALFDAHHGSDASRGERLENQSTDPDIQRLGQYVHAFQHTGTMAGLYALAAAFFAPTSVA